MEAVGAAALGKEMEVIGPKSLLTMIGVTIGLTLLQRVTRAPMAVGSRVRARMVDGEAVASLERALEAGEAVQSQARAVDLGFKYL